MPYVETAVVTSKTARVMWIPMTHYSMQFNVCTATLNKLVERKDALLEVLHADKHLVAEAEERILEMNKKERNKTHWPEAKTFNKHAQHSRKICHNNRFGDHVEKIKLSMRIDDDLEALRDKDNQIFEKRLPDWRMPPIQKPNVRRGADAGQRMVQVQITEVHDDINPELSPGRLASIRANQARVARLKSTRVAEAKKEALRAADAVQRAADEADLEKLVGVQTQAASQQVRAARDSRVQHSLVRVRPGLIQMNTALQSRTECTKRRLEEA